MGASLSTSSTATLKSRRFIWVTADGRLKATPLSVLRTIDGHGALVLDTIGTAAEPIYLLIGEENKHNGMLEVMQETIWVPECLEEL